jgi:hypothetical protein
MLTRLAVGSAGSRLRVCIDARAVCGHRESTAARFVSSMSMRIGAVLASRRLGSDQASGHAGIRENTAIRSDTRPLRPHPDLSLVIVTGT